MIQAFWLPQNLLSIVKCKVLTISLSSWGGRVVSGIFRYSFNAGVYLKIFGKPILLLIMLVDLNLAFSISEDQSSQLHKTMNGGKSHTIVPFYYESSWKESQGFLDLDHCSISCSKRRP